jgi:hypothetical protein
MKIIQIIPAPTGMVAAYRLEDESVMTEHVYCMALVERDRGDGHEVVGMIQEITWLEPADDSENFLGYEIGESNARARYGGGDVDNRECTPEMSRFIQVWYECTLGRPATTTTLVGLDRLQSAVRDLLGERSAKPNVYRELSYKLKSIKGISSNGLKVAHLLDKSGKPVKHRKEGYFWMLEKA